MNSELEITPVLEASLNTFECSGVLCALNISGKISTYSAGSIHHKEHNKKFYIYSITKTFTATAIMILCERLGNFLDKKLVDLLPETLAPSAITVRQLLNHSSGLSDYGSKEYQEAVCRHPDKPWSYNKLMEFGLKNTPLFEPGKGWGYSNPGYGLLKELIEELSGRDYYSFLKEYVFQPIGLYDTEAFIEPDTECTLLKGEDPSIAGDFRTQYHPGWIATGCLISTVSDITRFYQALFSGKLISKESLQQMKETVEVPFPATPPMVPAYGLGLMHGRNEPLGEAYGHGGGGPGYTTYAKHYPELLGTSFTLCLVLNRTIPATPFRLADNIVSTFVQLRQNA